jgi:hypothetical protein
MKHEIDVVRNQCAPSIIPFPLIYHVIYRVHVSEWVGEVFKGWCEIFTEVTGDKYHGHVSQRFAGTCIVKM